MSNFFPQVTASKEVHTFNSSSEGGNEPVKFEKCCSRDTYVSIIISTKTCLCTGCSRASKYAHYRDHKMPLDI
jgi:hypothetical protein